MPWDFNSEAPVAPVIQLVAVEDTSVLLEEWRRQREVAVAESNTALIA